MSKVSIELDTQTQELKVVVDGKALDNVTSASVYKYRDYYDDEEERVSVSISQRIEPEIKGDVCTHIMLSASANGDLVADKASETDLQRSISGFLNSKRKR